jgi:hypothetical protein
VTFRKVFAAVSATLTTLAAAIAVFEPLSITADDLLDVLWPVGLVVLLALLTAAAGLYILHLRREIDPDDQRSLDELLHVLNRNAIREIDSYDFYDAWPITLLHPVEVFVREFGDVEHEFTDPVMEEKRADLYAKAVALLGAQTGNAWRSKYNPMHNNPGMSIGEAEFDPEKMKLLEERAEAIRAKAFPFLDAHKALVQTARNRGYNLDALGRDRHPRVRDLDETYVPRQRRSWADPA